MDKEALRKQIYDELRGQFETKLKDAKKQKSQLEEELEASAEKWRTERRRLNAEVDRLEGALADARDARRKTPDAPAGRTSDKPESPKAQASADERLKKAEREWTEERKKLQAEIERLQGGIAELLERANNPMRAGQAVKHQLEGSLEEALKMKRQAEDALITAKADWEKEKLKLAGEMVKLRRGAGTKSSKEEADDEKPVRDLQKQLDQMTRTRDDVTAKLEQTRLEVAKLKEAQAADKEQLKTQLAQLKEAQSTMRSLEARLEESKGAVSKEQAGKLESQRAEAAAARQAIEGELKDGQRELQTRERKLAAVQKELETRESELNDARSQAKQMDEARSEELLRVSTQLQKSQAAVEGLEKQIATLKNLTKTEVDRAVAETHVQYSDQIRNLSREQSELSEKLRLAAEQLEEERARTAAGTKATSESSAPTTKLPASGGNGLGNSVDKNAPSGAVDSSAIDTEVARIEEMLDGITRVIDDPASELATVIRKNVERAELDAYLKGILFSVGRSRGL